MIKSISLLCIGGAVALGALTLVWTNAAVASGFSLGADVERLSALESDYQELKSRYLKALLARIEPKAKEAGFVAVASPRYVAAQNPVSFLDR